MKWSGAEDAELLRSVASGDESALRELFDRHAAWLQLRLQRRTKDPEVVADVLQDTFVAVWQSAGKYRGDGDVGAWLWGISIRRLISRIRGRRSPIPMATESIGWNAPTVASAEDELLIAIEYGALGPAMRVLSPELQTIMQVTVLDGLTTREAAHLLGIPQGTVKSRARAAREQLRRQLLTYDGGTS